ncbi:DUF262 domain-containing protein [Halorhodospira halophila]|uniref:DUF262 domain-containing protein n=1 Tax=Halorhodospira halophila TaxID=1053 RepID=UPI001F5D3244|nr:DUF262 domain-containing protein [Halorhodospira halophila]MBK5944755.1 hypothetical protein [Halorhodospira halophila]
MHIDAKVHSIQELKDFYFVVPDYQREYVWEADDQVEQFLSDIDNEYEPGTHDQPAYFLGSIIIVNREGKFDVIDGQQRLTTIVLSLCVMRDLMKGLKLDQRQSNYLKTIQEWLSHFDIKTDGTQVRLELQYEESRDYLARLIMGQHYNGEETASIRRMSEAYRRVNDHFCQYLDKGLNELTNYARYLLTSIEMVVIKSENLSSALKIFETINQRGVGLNAMDLVKNLLFSEARESDFSAIKETWQRIVKNLESCRDGDKPLRFLKYFLVGRYHRGVLREDEIYKWIISTTGKSALNYQSEPLNLAREMERLSERYARLVNATEDFSNNSAYPSVSNIGFINKYGSRQHLVLLLALPQGSSDQLLDYLASQIESFFFFSNAIGIQGRENERLFARWAAELRQAKDRAAIDEVVRSRMLQYLKDRLPEFRGRFTTLNHTAFNPLYRQRFILGRMENTIRQQAGMSQHGNNFIQSLQVEHIFPQTPHNDVIPPEFEDMEAYQLAVAKLGNVTLLEGMINQAVNNFNDLESNWFCAKQAEYVKSNVIMTNMLDPKYQIGKNTGLNRVREKIGYFFESWSRESIEIRQRVLMELAFETWTLSGERVDKH